MARKKLQPVALFLRWNYPVTPMPKTGKKERGRTVWIPTFGAALEQARGRWDKGTVLQRVRDFSPAFTHFDQSRLNYYEAGAVQSPDALLVWALSLIYGRSLVDLLHILKWNREHLYTSVDPEEVGHVGEADTMRLTADDKGIIRRLRSLPSLDQERVIHYMDTLVLATGKGGAQDAGEATFRRRKRG